MMAWTMERSRGRNPGDMAQNSWYDRYLFVSPNDLAVSTAALDAYFRSRGFRRVSVAEDQKSRLLTDLFPFPLTFTVGTTAPSTPEIASASRQYWMLTPELPFSDGVDFFQEELARISRACREKIWYVWNNRQLRSSTGYQTLRNGKVLKTIVLYEWIRGIEIDGQAIEWQQESPARTWNDYLESESFQSKLVFFFPRGVLDAVKRLLRPTRALQTSADQIEIYLHHRFASVEQFAHAFQRARAMRQQVTALYSNVLVFIVIGMLIFFIWLFLKNQGIF